MNYVEKVLRHYKLILLLALAVTVLLAPWARRGVIDNRMEENVLNDEKLDNYYDFLKTFGNDRILIAAFNYDSISAELVRALYDLEEKIAATGFVEETISPVSILKDTFDMRERASIEIWLKSPSRLNNYARKLASFECMTATIISPEKKTASMLLRLGSSVTDMDTKKIGLLIDLIEKDPFFAGRIKVTGIPTLTNVIHDYTAHDQKIFTPITMGIIMVILYILYRSFWSVLIPLIGITLPLIWTQAMFNINGNHTNFIVSMIPPLLLGIGLSACMYVYSRYSELSQGKECFDPALVYQTVSELTAPTFLCQLSTIIGFAALGGNGLGAVRSFGLYASLGVLFTLYVSLFLVPSLILFFKPFNQRVTSFQTGHRAFRWLASFAIKRHKLVFLAIGGLLATSIYGLSKLEMETSLIRFLPPDHEVIRKNRFVEDNLFGIVPIQLVLSCAPPEGVAGTLEDTLLSPRVCNAVSDLSAEIRKIAEVDSAVSYVTFIQDYDREFSREKNHIPPSAEEIKDYLDFFKSGPSGSGAYEIVEYEVDETGNTFEVAVYPETPGTTADSRAVQLLDKFITRDYLKANLALRVKDTNSRRLSEIFKQIEALAAKHLPPNVRFHLTGRAYLWAASSELLIRNEYHDWLLTTLMVLVMLIFYFRSLPVAAMALIPNLLPTFVLYGYMGLTGMPLTTVTGMIASVALGLAVDDTIHYTYELRRVLKRVASYEEAVTETLLIKGSGIAFSSIVVAAGFSAPMASRFIPSFQFGALVCFSVAQALVFELFLTPSMWYWYKPFKPAEWAKDNKKVDNKELENSE